MRLSQERKTLEQQKKTVNKLTLVPCGDQFPTCRYIKDAHEEKTKISKQKELIEDLEKKTLESEESLTGLDIHQAERDLHRYDRLLSEESSLVKEIANIDMHGMDGQIDRKQREMEQHKKKLLELRSGVVDQDHKKKLSILKSSIKQCETDIAIFDQERKQADRRIGQIEHSIDKLQEEQALYVEVSNQMRMYDRLSFAFSKKGIPSQIIKAELPIINAEIATLLHGVSDFVVELEVDDESNKLEIYINYGDSRRPIEVCSGMERTLASMAIRVALMNVSSLPKINMIILDEAFDKLDNKNIDATVRMFESLKRWFKTIFIVSHNEAIKNISDQQIEIGKKGKDAHIYHCEECRH
jgi:DNA repair exonuclease SbcCD ATPase subunit